MELFNPSLINSKILQYIEKINNIESLSDNCREELSKGIEQVIPILKQRCKSFNSIDEQYKGPPDQFGIECEDPSDEYEEMKKLTYDFIHLFVYLQYLIILYTDLKSEDSSEIDKIDSIKRCISSIQYPEEIMTDTIDNVFSTIEYNDDD